MANVCPLQSSIDALNTITPILAQLMADIYIKQCTYTYGQCPPPIKHRCLEYHYTKLGTTHGKFIYIKQCKYTYGQCLPPCNLA